MSIHQENSKEKQYPLDDLQMKYVLYPPVNVLILEGKDALDFIHRMSTNDVLGLVEGIGTTTIFTNEKGRIIDVVDLYHLNGSIHLVHSADAREDLKKIFEKYVIMEDVSIQEYPDHTCILSLYGSTGSKEIFSGEAGSLEMSSPRIFPDGKLFYVAKKNVSDMSLIKNGEHVDFKTVNMLRLEKGIPLLNQDYDSSINPLESNLQEFVSWTKGCYIGQEVIARLDTYQKIKRFLKGVVLDDHVSEKDIDRYENEDVEPVIFSIDNTEAGKVTSLGYSPTLNTSILMARFEKGKEKTGDKVTLKLGDSEYTGTIVDLPFVKGDNG